MHETIPEDILKVEITEALISEQEKQIQFPKMLFGKNKGDG